MVDMVDAVDMVGVGEDITMVPSVEEDGDLEDTLGTGMDIILITIMIPIILMILIIQIMGIIILIHCNHKS